MAMIAALLLGATTGASLGRVIGNRPGAIIGALVGAVAAAIVAWLLAAGTILQGRAAIDAVTIVAALGCGLMAGFFFSFSFLVMQALARQPQASGIATMQTINIVVFNPVFGSSFILAAAACLVVMLGALTRAPGPDTFYLLTGGGLYLTGTLLVTAVCNVPRNDRLAAVDAKAPAANAVWTDYLATWTPWNSVRTFAALAATALLIFALTR